MFKLLEKLLDALLKVWTSLSRRVTKPVVDLIFMILTFFILQFATILIVGLLVYGAWKIFH